jgi:hypothetical protein
MREGAGEWMEGSEFGSKIKFKGGKNQMDSEEEVETGENGSDHSGGRRGFRVRGVNKIECDGILLSNVDND